MSVDISSARAGRTPVLAGRVLDVVLSASLLCVLAAPMLLLALLVKLTSRGPAVYTQERAGLGGKPFVMFKFRTMRVDAETETGPVWAKRGDPRRTAVGTSTGASRGFGRAEIGRIERLVRENAAFC